MVGQLWGPCNEANVNGNHPALLVGLKCNGDVQLPDTFPILEHTHCPDKGLCTNQCDQKVPIFLLVKEAQLSQQAQALCAAGYQCKRLPIAVHEIKEWMKAQKALIEALQDNKAGYVGARLAKRMVTHCYARGLCRGIVACENLLLHLTRPRRGLASRAMASADRLAKQLPPQAHRLPALDSVWRARSQLRGLANVC